MFSDIRALSIDNKKEIIPLIRACILNRDELHIGELVANERNVYSFFECEIRPIIDQKNPILGMYKDGNLIGLSCCLTIFNQLYELKHSIALGTVTLIHPSHRQKGVGTQLRTAINKELKNLGIEKFIFEIKQKNTASLKNAQKIAQDKKIDAKLISLRFQVDNNVY